MSCGILLGSLIASGVSLAFSQTQIAAGFWRIPFVIGGVFGFVAMLLRRWLQETPVFQEMQRRAAVSRELPLQAILRGHKRAIAASVLSTWMLTAAIVVVILMTPSLLQKTFHLPARDVQFANLAATVTLCLSTVAIGALADRFGLRRTAIPVLLLLVTATYALYVAAGRLPSALLPTYFLAGMGAGGAVLAPVFMVRAFPASVRFTGVSFSYNTSYAIFGGVTPLLVSWLAHLNPLGPSHYVAIVTLLGLLAVLVAPTARPVTDEFTRITESRAASASTTSRSGAGCSGMRPF